MFNLENRRFFVYILVFFCGSWPWSLVYMNRDVIVSKGFIISHLTLLNYVWYYGKKLTYLGKYFT